MITRLLGCAAGSLAFGAFDAELYARPQTFWLANLSSAYFVLAFVVGAVTGRRSIGLAAAGGAVATALALTAFYATQAAQRIGPATFDQALFARYALPGLITGPVFAALGARWVRRRSWWALLPVAAALALEPSAWRARLGFDPGSGWTWTTERATGITLAVLALINAVNASRRSTHHGPHRA